MRGHLTERRPGVWRLVVSDGFDPDGGRRQITRTVRGSKRDAERALTQMLRDRDQGMLADGRQTLEHYLTGESPGGVGRVQTRSRARADHQAALCGLGTPRLREHRTGPPV